MVPRLSIVAMAAFVFVLTTEAFAPASKAYAQGTNLGGFNFGNNGGNHGRRRGYDGGGFSFTGPPEFYTDGRMTCHRAKAVMRFRLGYTDLVVHNCQGRRYQIEGRRAGQRWLVTLDAFTTNPVSTRRLR
jgi:hypothetical protein